VYIWCSAINSTTYCCQYKKTIDKNQKPTHTQKTNIKWDTADKDKYIELVNEGIQSSDLTLETAKDVEIKVGPISFVYIWCSAIK
jgi:hypothetical protein